MNESAKAPWTSARCNRLLRPLSSKIALLRKATLSELRHDERNSGIAPSSSSQNSATATKVDVEWENSPRPWKKIRRTYSSKTKVRSFREFVDIDKDRAFAEATDAAIRLPLCLTAGQVRGDDEDLAAKDGQHDIPGQRALPRDPRGTSKNVQVFHNSQVLGSDGSTGLGNRRLIEGICKALEALLRATTCEKTSDHRGGRSLYSICLRQVPSYIAEDQRLTNDEDLENHIDVASEVYTDLEAFGSVPDGGWESLREVVRAHGVSLVGEAIQEGLIEISLSCHIVSLCLGLAAYDEAECVIECMITLLKYRSLSPEKSTVFCAGLSHPINKSATSHRLQTTLLTDEASRVAGALKYCASKTGRHGFMYRQTAVMLEDGILPVGWISSKAMIKCWNGAIRSITQQDDHARSAALLLQIAISKSYRRGVSNAKASPQVHDLRLRACEPFAVRPTLRSYKSSRAVETVAESQPTESGEAGARPDDVDNALQSTFSNVLTVLSAINILRSAKSGMDSRHPNLLSVGILRDVALEIRQVLELSNATSCANRSWSVPAKLLRLPLLSAGLVSVTSRKPGTGIAPNDVLDLAALASLPSSKESLSNAGSFLGEVARCCDEPGSGDGFRFVQVMVQDLISVATSNIYDKPTRRFCCGIAHAAAFAFSEDTGQPKHLEWALDVEGTITRTVDASPSIVVDKTPTRDVMRNKSEYKWEEGICEWIAKTPALALQRPIAVEDVDRDSTYGEAPKLTLVQALPLLSGLSQSPCVTDRRLPRPKRRHLGRGASCDSCEIGNVEGSYGNSNSTEKLFFIRESPRPQKVPRTQILSKVHAANDLDELSTPESSQEKPIALREIPNLPSGGKKEIPDRKHNNKVIESYSLDMLRTKRHRLDTETFSQCMDDELGFP